MISHRVLKNRTFNRVLKNGTFKEQKIKAGEPIYLTGYFFINAPLPPELTQWQDALPHLQFGGDGGYGYGRVSLVGSPVKTGSFWDGYQFDLSEQNPIVTIKADPPVLAHVDASSGTDQLLDGPLVPWMGRDTDHTGHGGTRTQPRTMWVPGSKAILKFKITKFGFWEPC